MNIYRYSVEEVKKELRAKAKEICQKLAPVAVEVEIIDALRRIKVFVKCLED